MIDFSQDEILRYSRHFSLPSVGMAGQKHLKAAKVLCVGAGGLGSPLVLYLAAAGIGHIGLVDGDVVEASNLQRQIIFNTSDQGQNKATAAAQHLANLNPFIHINPYPVSLNSDNALEIIQQYDIVADATDNFQTRYLINDASYHLKKPVVYASIFQFEGQATVFNAGQGPCYRCLYREAPPPELMPNCAEAGVLGILPGIMGCIQATEIIKFILEVGNSLSGRLLLFNALTMQFREFVIQKDSNCLLCGHNNTPFLELQRPSSSCPAADKEHLATEEICIEEISIQELKSLQETTANFTLLDVRQPYEYEIVNLGGVLIPLSELNHRYAELDKNQLIVVHCKSGKRSQQASHFLKQQGFSQVRSLKGGILAWIQEFNPELPRY